MGQRWVFQQDNDPNHVRKSTKKRFPRLNSLNMGQTYVRSTKKNKYTKDFHLVAGVELKVN